LTNWDYPFISLLEDIVAAWQAGVSMDGVLSRFVVETDARASGCWRLEEGCLRLIGFGWASDMPAEVSQGFQDATRRVPLDQTGLGIVKAALGVRPVVGHRDPGSTGLEGSASWIAKFQANSSLAVPIREPKRGTILGVFAVSTASAIIEGDRLWNVMLRVSEELGR